jgi:hypothetical protein
MAFGLAGCFKRYSREAAIAGSEDLDIFLDAGSKYDLMPSD